MAFSKLLSVLCALCLLTLTLAQHGEEGETGDTKVEAESEPLPPCARPLDELHHSIEELFGENYTVYINCLSFDAEGALRTGIASGENPGEPNMRFVIECRGEILVAQPEVIANTTIDRTDIRDTSCLECNTSLADGSCTEMCDLKCDRCYESVTKCTRCTACTSQESKECKYEEGRSLACAETCPSASTVNHELYNYCECVLPNVLFLFDYSGAPEEQEIECEEEERTLPGTCVADCRTGNPAYDPNDETRSCWACGIAYCVRCNREANECTTCLRDTVLYEHECIPCPLAPIAIAAIEQEHEIEEEEHERSLRTIELAVTLPIASVLIIVFFVGMSIFAHHRYPHVSYHGNKRHRKPPTVERSVSPTIVDDDNPPQETHHVWRPRPTIVLR